MPPGAEYLDAILVDRAKAFNQIRMIVPVGGLEENNYSNTLYIYVTSFNMKVDEIADV